MVANVQLLFSRVACLPRKVMNHHAGLAVTHQEPLTGILG